MGVEGVVEWPAVSPVERLTIGAKEDRLFGELWGLTNYNVGLKWEG